MKDEKLGQEPAFPVESLDFGINGVIAVEKNGMSKRFYAACAAMQGLLSNPNIKRPDHRDENGHIEFANVCFQYAYELLKQENQ